MRPIMIFLAAALSPSAAFAASGDVVDTMVGFIYLVLLVVIYFLPAVVAFSRRHRNAVPILLVTLFGAWTVVLWLVALVWSFTSNVPERGEGDLSVKKCPDCAMVVLAEAKKCRYCGHQFIR